MSLHLAIVATSQSGNVSCTVEVRLDLERTHEMPPVTEQEILDLIKTTTQNNVDAATAAASRLAAEETGEGGSGIPQSIPDAITASGVTVKAAIDALGTSTTTTPTTLTVVSSADQSSFVVASDGTDLTNKTLTPVSGSNLGQPAQVVSSFSFDSNALQATLGFPSPWLNAIGVGDTFSVT